MKPGLALFDFDGTITSKDTMLEFIAHLRGRKALWFGLLITSPVLLLGRSGLLPSKIAKEMFLKRSFKGLTKEQIEASAEVFTEEVLPTLLREDALEEIARHKSLGHDVAIVTASCSLWVEKWAVEKYNTTLIATQLNDNLEGGIKGDNNNGPKKVENIVSIYDLNTYDHIYAYGDSRGDAEMMKLAHTSYYRFFN